MDNLRLKVNYDEITGLYNRGMLKEQQQVFNSHTMNEKATIAALMMDIDHFKNINDKYGHLKGDEVIVAVSNVIKAVLQGDGQPFRYGGDEFMIVLVNRELGRVQEICENIRKQIEKLRVEGIEEKITTSIGMAFKPKAPKIDFKTLLARADEMMYRSKAKGGNCISEADL